MDSKTPWCALVVHTLIILWQLNVYMFCVDPVLPCLFRLQQHTILISLFLILFLHVDHMQRLHQVSALFLFLPCDDLLSDTICTVFIVPPPLIRYATQHAGEYVFLYKCSGVTKSSKYLLLNKSLTEFLVLCQCVTRYVNGI